MLQKSRVVQVKEHDGFAVSMLRVTFTGLPTICAVVHLHCYAVAGPHTMTGRAFADTIARVERGQITPHLLWLIAKRGFPRGNQQLFRVGVVLDAGGKAKIGQVTPCPVFWLGSTFVDAAQNGYRDILFPLPRATADL